MIEDIFEKSEDNLIDDDEIDELVDIIKDNKKLGILSKPEELDFK